MYMYVSDTSAGFYTRSTHNICDIVFEAIAHALVSLLRLNKLDTRLLILSALNHSQK